MVVLGGCSPSLELPLGGGARARASCLRQFTLLTALTTTLALRAFGRASRGRSSPPWMQSRRKHRSGPAARAADGPIVRSISRDLIFELGLVHIAERRPFAAVNGALPGLQQ